MKNIISLTSVALGVTTICTSWYLSLKHDDNMILVAGTIIAIIFVTMGVKRAMK